MLQENEWNQELLKRKEQCRNQVLQALNSGNQKEVVKALKKYVDFGFPLVHFGKNKVAIATVIAFHGSREGLSFLQEKGFQLDQMPELLSCACSFYCPNGSYVECIKYLIDNGVGVLDVGTLSKAIEQLKNRKVFLKCGEQTPSIKVELMSIDALIARLQRRLQKIFATEK